MSTEINVVKLRRGSINTLSNLLQGTGWYDDTKTAYLAGSVLVNALPEASESPRQVDGTPVSGDKLKAWLDETSDIQLSPAQIKVCAKCIEYFVKQKQIATNVYTFELMDKLGMAPKEE